MEGSLKKKISEIKEKRTRLRPSESEAHIPYARALRMMRAAGIERASRAAVRRLQRRIIERSTTLALRAYVFAQHRHGILINRQDVSNALVGRKADW